MKIAAPLAKNILLSRGLIAAASAADARIRKKDSGICKSYNLWFGFQMSFRLNTANSNINNIE